MRTRIYAAWCTAARAWMIAMRGWPFWIHLFPHREGDGLPCDHPLTDCLPPTADPVELSEAIHVQWPNLRDPVVGATIRPLDPLPQVWELKVTPPREVRIFQVPR